MKLRDFIKETLVEIAYGLKEAKFATKELIAVAPNTIEGDHVAEKSYVDFDVAVTVNEKNISGKDGKAGIRAEIEVLGSKIGGELGGGVSGANEAMKETVSRIVFKVPIYMAAHYRGNQAILEEEKEWRSQMAKESGHP